MAHIERLLTAPDAEKLFTDIRRFARAYSEIDDNDLENVRDLLSAYMRKTPAQLTHQQQKFVLLSASIALNYVRWLAHVECEDELAAALDALALDDVQLPKPDAKQPRRAIKRRCKIAQLRRIEAHAISSGCVHKGAQEKCSDYAHAVRSDDLDKQKLFAEQHVLKCTDGTEIPMSSGSGQMHNRISELFVRAKGLEKIAEKAGMLPVFVTLTLPGEYHAHSTNQDKRASVWNGMMPWDSSRTLARRVKLLHDSLRQHADFYAVKGVEAHEDGTPHMHALYYLHDERHLEILEQVVRKHFGKSDIRVIKKEKENDASPTTYIIKYAIKSLNINDGECSRDLTARYVSQRRGYEIIDETGSTTKWREMRRIQRGSAEYDALGLWGRALWKCAHKNHEGKYNYQKFLEILQFLGARIRIIYNENAVCGIEIEDEYETATGRTFPKIAQIVTHGIKNWIVVNVLDRVLTQHHAKIPI